LWLPEAFRSSLGGGLLALAQHNLPLRPLRGTGHKKGINQPISRANARRMGRNWKTLG